MNKGSTMTTPTDLRSTALVLIDLQKGILGFSKAPHSAAQVLARAAQLVAHFRAAGSPIVRVKVGWSADGGDRLLQPTDTPAPGGPALPADWLDDPDELPTAASDLRIVKRQWNAFHGTELDLQLRRRGIRRIVLAGIATPFGVEGTARAAWELGYELVVVEDACGAPVEAAHQGSVAHVLPRLGQLRSTAQVLAAH
jgi:nicotinamidase-related amidase